MKKRIFALMLAFVMLFAVAACKSKPKVEAPASDEPVIEVPLGDEASDGEEVLEDEEPITEIPVF